MPDQIQNILNRIVDWWKKFSTKQKVMLCSITAVILLSLVILAVVVSQPTMVPLITCESTKQSSEVKNLLDSNSEIRYKVSDNGLVYTVDKRDEAIASILLGANNIPTKSYSIDNVTNGSFTTTAADKQKKWIDYLEKKFEDHLERMDLIDDAVVDITMAKDDGTILAREEQSTVAVSLRLNGKMGADQATTLAQYIATQIGNKNTDGITITSTAGEMLFSGLESNSELGIANTQLSTKQKMEDVVRNEVKGVMTQSSLFTNVAIGINLNVNFSNIKEVEHTYSPADGKNTGMIKEESTYDANAKGGMAAVPGTDSNGDDTSYVTPDGDFDESSISESKKYYENNEKIREIMQQGGVVDYKNSSIALVATKTIVHDEQVLKSMGQLDDMTFDEYIAANDQPIPMEIDDSLYELVANATGFPRENITITGYQDPQFIRAPKSGRTVSDILQIVLAVLIFLMLGYVVFRSTRPQKDGEEEPEISVEDLMTPATESQMVDEIGYAEKSDIRIMIEKFVDENPDAAALLLRNWLNEEWE